MDCAGDGIIKESTKPLSNLDINGQTDNLSTASAPIDDGLRSAWQWIAMITMFLDHIGYLYPDYYVADFFKLDYLRYAGRLAMPLYGMLVALSIRSRQIHNIRLLVLGLISQIPYFLLFNQSIEYEYEMNIVLGFYIFYLMTAAIEKRCWWGIAAVAGLMCLPVSYGWYLYASMATFYWLDRKRGMMRGVFGMVTVVYTYFSYFYHQPTAPPRLARQVLAALSPFIGWIKLPRPNKYIYRYFYPGHLFILLIVDFMIMGFVVTPFGTYTREFGWFTPEEWQYIYYYDPNPQYYDEYLLLQENDSDDNSN